MALSHEYTGPEISAKVKIYILSKAKLLCSLCYEIPCSTELWRDKEVQFFPILHIPLKLFFRTYTNECLWNQKSLLILSLENISFYKRVHSFKI